MATKEITHIECTQCGLTESLLPDTPRHHSQNFDCESILCNGQGTYTCHNCGATTLSTTVTDEGEP